jgi:hypothetical protein
MSVGSLEEIIDDNHAIVSTSVGSEHYVSILSFVDKDQLEPGCSVLLNHRVHAVSCIPNYSFQGLFTLSLVRCEIMFNSRLLVFSPMILIQWLQ